MPSLRVSHSVSRKSFREMEKIDRIAQHGDYPTLLSYSPRKQAAACARANARLYRLPICYSIKQITGMQFKVVPSQSRLHEFRAISYGCVYIHVHIYNICLCVCACAYIHIYIRFQFLFSGRVCLSTSQRNAVAAQPRFVVSVVSSAVRCRK